MKKIIFILLLFISLLYTCSTTNILAKVELKNCPVSDGFDFPVGKPDSKKYYNAQKFGKNYHLGDDWNGISGGNSDFGDPVFSISNGIVFFAGDIKGGWGNIVRIYHNYGTSEKPIYIESIYAHLDRILVKSGDLIKKGDKIGTIGNANGQYFSHLHFEIRDKINMKIGRGYSKNTTGYLDPTAFINKYRILPD